MWSKKPEPRVLEPTSTLPVKSPLDMVKDVTTEYEDLLRRIYHNVDEMRGVKKNPISLYMTYYSMKMLFENWLRDADAKREEDAEREKIAKIVREELENKVNKKCLKQS